MKARFSLCLLALLAAACSRTTPVAAAPNVSTGGRQAPAINLTAAAKEKIGRKIWQNESAGKVSGLTAWNKGEGFPSLGIGHFIWYPAGKDGPFTESWPQFVQFARQRGANPPAVALQRDCPWPNRSAFQGDFNGPRLSGLRQWLSRTVALQTDFIAQKSLAALPKITAGTSAAEAARIRTNYRNVATSPQGVYALIDYVNFKGEGTNPKERYRNQGWGLKQVLQEMQPTAAGPAAAREFAAAADRTLTRRVRNSPPKRGEKRWLAGWKNRAASYGRPL